MMVAFCSVDSYLFPLSTRRRPTMMKSIKRLFLRRDTIRALTELEVIGDKPVPCTYFTRMISTCIAAGEAGEAPADE
jgi:hypothetical protein